ncbi:hypothetical protein D3C85_1477210 [compost metagenome]
MRTLGITSDRAGLGVRPGATLVADFDPELLVDHDFFGRRHGMFIRESQAIETKHFNIHLRQLGIVADELFYACSGAGAVEAGLVGSRRFGFLGSIGTRDCRHAYADEKAGEKGRDRFHVDVTRIIY